jgi:hypothetical protein
VIYNVTTGLPSNIGSSRTELLAGRFKPEAMFSPSHVNRLKVKKVKVSRYRPGVAQRVSGALGSKISMKFGT